MIISLAAGHMSSELLVLPFRGQCCHSPARARPYALNCVERASPTHRTALEAPAAVGISTQGHRRRLWPGLSACLSTPGAD